MLQINSISKSYLGKTVLDNVSFSVGKREFIGLIGKNGTGKTTLLRIIAELEEPDQGSIQKVPRDFSIGYLSQEQEVENNQSSGERIRKLLRGLLSQSHDLLLLDEPTNHLDFEALDWLEKSLRNYRGSVIVVSHDRKFLDNLASKIIELDRGKIKIYGGNYSFYKNQREIEKESYERKYFIQQKKIQRAQNVIGEIESRARSIESETVDFHYLKRAAKVARKAVNQRKKLERFIESEERLEKPEIDYQMTALFGPKRESSKTIVFAQNISKSFGDKKILNNINLLVERGDRVALSGPNGSGKTSLISIITGKLAADSGTIEIGNNVDIGYLPQEQTDIRDRGNIVDWLIKETGRDKTDAYKLARHFLFEEEDINIPVKDLSSGQKSRLVLAEIMASGANFLILDEPTNHLDIPAREALEKSLKDYKGTLLVVSHDRYFLDMININRTIELENYETN